MPPNQLQKFKGPLEIRRPPALTVQKPFTHPKFLPVACLPLPSGGGKRCPPHPVPGAVPLLPNYDWLTVWV